MNWYMVLAVYATWFWLFWVAIGRGFWESLFWPLMLRHLRVKLTLSRIAKEPTHD